MTLEEEDDLTTYQVTEKGKRMLRKFEKNYLKAWKSGHDEEESQEIALQKVNYDILDVALIKFIQTLNQQEEEE